MKIVVAVRCLNEIEHIDRFMRGYDFADEIVVSDGGSTDGSRELLHIYPKVRLIHFDFGEIINGVFWNTDAPHMNFVLDAAKALEPDFLIFDDMDCSPTKALGENARKLIEETLPITPVITLFRLYMWGEEKYFPKVSGHFSPDFTSLWGWNPREVDIHADPDARHGTMVGITDNQRKLATPYSLLHRTWHPDTIQQKMDRYNALGLPMNHPFTWAGELEDLPEWAHN